MEGKRSTIATAEIATAEILDIVIVSGLAVVLALVTAVVALGA